MIRNLNEKIAKYKINSSYKTFGSSQDNYKVVPCPTCNGTGRISKGITK